MAVRLRLRRMGRKKRPFYRIVAADQRAPRDGRFIEVVGQYDPLQKPQMIELKEDRIYYWLANGAQPSTTVRSLLRSKGILMRLDLKARGLTDDQIEAEMLRWQETKIAREKRREAAEIQARSKKEQEKEKKKVKESEKTVSEKKKESEAEETKPEEAKTEEKKTEEVETEETVQETEEQKAETAAEKPEAETVETVEPAPEEKSEEAEKQEESQAQTEETEDKKE